MLRMQHKRGLHKLAAALALVVSLIAQPALAAAPQQAEKSDPDSTSYKVSCQNGVCSVAFDLGGIQVASDVPLDAPVKLDLPAGAIPFLSKGVSLEISDSINLNLPFGSIKLKNGDFELHLDKDGQLDRLHGASTEIVPSLNLGPNLQIAGPFGAEIGYDLGSTLDGFSTVLDPDQRYLFFHLGGGLQLDTTMPGGSQDGQPLRFSIPEGDRFSIVIDPQSALVYLDGQLSLAQLTDLGMVMGLFGLTPATFPLLNGVILPTRTTIGVGALLSPDMSKNFLQLSGGMGINGGPLGKLLRLEGEPLAFDGMMRVDANGLALGGVASSAINPNQVLETRGELSLYIPFSGDELPYLQVGGKLRVPLVGLETEVAQQIGGGAVSELASTNALLQSTTQAASSWWEKSGAQMSSLAGMTAGASQLGLNALENAAANTSESITQGAKTVWSATSGGATKAADGAGAAVNAGAAGAATIWDGTASGAAAAWDNTAAAAACAAQRTRQLWCQTTGLCPVEEVVCD